MQNIWLLAYTVRLVFAIVKLQPNKQILVQEGHMINIWHLVRNYLLGAESTNQKRYNTLVQRRCHHTGAGHS